MMVRQNPATNDTAKPGYESEDASTTKIIIVGIISALLLIVILIALKQYFQAATEKQVYEAVLKPESVALRELRVKENETLNSYKIIDAQNGVYQIPIDSAMQILARESRKRDDRR